MIHSMSFMLSFFIDIMNALVYTLGTRRGRRNLQIILRAASDRVFFYCL